MGMCEGCRGVFSVSDMKDGYCEACQISKSNENQINKDNSSLKIAILVSIVLSIIAIAFFLYEINSKPKEEIVKNIASQYPVGFFGIGVPESQIKIIDNYKKEGKIYYILQLDKNVCEMPMLKIDEKWTALGISCK